MKTLSIKNPLSGELNYFRVREDSSDEKVINEIYNKRVYIKKDFSYLPSDSWLDLGANIGVFSVLISGSVKNIIAIEPEKENFQLLKMNLSLNNINNVECINKAVVPTSFQGSSVNLFVNSDNFWKHSLWPKRKRGVKKVAVPVIKFNELPEYNIKMDIEGAELLILDNEKVFNNKIIIMEYDFQIDKRLDAFWQRLEKLEMNFKVIFSRRNSMKKSGFWLDSWFPPNEFLTCIRKD